MEDPQQNPYNSPQSNPGPAGAPPAAIADKVKTPAIVLMVVTGIGALFALAGLVLNIMGTGLSAVDAAGGGDMAMQNMMSGTTGIISSIIGLLIAGFVFYGAKQMMDLKNHSIAVAASVLIMIPFCSPCCVLGLPVGIWALVVLLDDNVKAAFEG